MRKAAGIILIIMGIGQVANMVASVVGVWPGSFINSGSLFRGLWYLGYWPIIYGALFITGGILSIGKRYWGLCLISALLALVGGIYSVVNALLLGFTIGYLSETWGAWLLVVGALISIIFISLRKKEWQGISDSVDGTVS